MPHRIPQVMYERLALLLDADGHDRDELITRLGLSSDDESTLRELLREATETSEFDLGVAAMFPELVGETRPELSGFTLKQEIGRGGITPPRPSPGGLWPRPPGAG